MCALPHCTGGGVEKGGVVLALKTLKVEHPLAALGSYTVTSNRYKCQVLSSVELYARRCFFGYWAGGAAEERI